jgi:hypothetical protein
VAAVLDAATGVVQFTATTGSTNAQPPTVDGTGSFITGAADGRVRAFPVAGWSGKVVVGLARLELATS